MIDEDAHEVVVLISAGIAVRKCGTLGVDCRLFRKPCLIHAHRRRVAPASGDCLVSVLPGVSRNDIWEYGNGNRNG